LTDEEEEEEVHYNGYQPKSTTTTFASHRRGVLLLLLLLLLLAERFGVYSPGPYSSFQSSRLGSTQNPNRTPSEIVDAIGTESRLVIK